VRIGFVYNVRRIDPTPLGKNDDEAEFDTPEILGDIRAAIASHGHDVVDLEADRTLPGALVEADVGVVFNNAEGRGVRGREAHVPALLEFLGIEHTGSDAVTMGIALDKSLAKVVVAGTGVRVPAGVVVASGEELLPNGLDFPLIVKPAHEGSSKGIDHSSVVSDERELREVVADRLARYQQPVLVESYVSGREITVGLLGKAPRVLPPMEVLFPTAGALPVYSFGMKHGTDPVSWEIPATLTDEEREAVERTALASFQALGCRDVGRVDLRLSGGDVFFIECNPLPGLTWGWSDLCLAAEAAGFTYEELIGEILDGALDRHAAHDG